MNRKPFNFDEWQKDPTQPLWLSNGDRVVEIKYYPKEYDDIHDALYLLVKSKIGRYMYNVTVMKDGTYFNNPECNLMMERKTSTKRLPFDLDIYLATPGVKVFTRNGNLAFIHYFKNLNPIIYSPYCIVGFVNLVDAAHPQSWTKEGYFHFDKEENEKDLFLEIEAI